MPNLEDKIKNILAEEYEKRGHNIAYLSRTAGGPVYTGFQLAEEIRNETEEGMKHIRMILALTVHLLSRDVIAEK